MQRQRSAALWICFGGSDKGGAVNILFVSPVVCKGLLRDTVFSIGLQMNFQSREKPIKPIHR